MITIYSIICASFICGAAFATALMWANMLIAHSRGLK